MARKASALAALAAAFAVVGMGLFSLVSESATVKPTCANDMGAGVSWTGAGSKGRYQSEEAAVRAVAEQELKNYGEIRRGSDGRYVAQRDGRNIAIFDVDKLPQGGYEVGGMVVCADNLREDSDQP
jgi:hypothetical protein